MEHSTGIATLIFKYIRKDLTDVEADQLQRWIEASEKNRLFFEEATTTGHLFAEAQSRDEADREIDMPQAWQKLLNRGIPVREYHPYYPSGSIVENPARQRWYYAAAAVVFLALLAGGYFWLNREQPVKDIVVTPTKQQPVKNDVSPLTRKATLTLADGTVVVLDSAQSGVLAVEGSTSVTKKFDGQLVYDMADSAQSVLYNTLSVPRGGNVVHITMSDGTKVWLNAASTLHYPVAFTGDERRVEISGEAYFEVAPNADAPFVVNKGSMEIAVLGTSFNVNAYGEEDDVKVTLLEGKVKVMNEGTAILKPGEQAVVNQTGEISVHRNFDQEAVMAWKNGLFHFDNTSIEVIIRQIERWYDVSIEYDSTLKNVAFNGQISRYSKASEVLEMLEAAEAIHFRIKDRKIYLTPYKK